LITVGRKTELCELAEKHGTDKWFYYTAFYHDLLKDRREKVKRVLELGIGSPATMLDSLSRAGIAEYKTGASLFLWREYFPNAEIIGLDIDRSTFVHSCGIRCFYCDQRDPMSYPLAVLGQSFDFIVDDAMHEKEPQLTAVKTLMPNLAPDGIYIIEDVGYLGHEARREFLEEIPYPSQLVEFHNPRLGPHIAACIVVRHE
jgi:SAM-dependent methyltransferase